MKLQCWYCYKSVSTELPKETLFRAIAVCPECIEKSPEASEHPLYNVPKNTNLYKTVLVCIIISSIAAIIFL